MSTDNVQVTVDAEKQKIKIDKRGLSTIAIQANNLPSSMTTSQLKVDKNEQDDEIYMSASETNKMATMNQSLPAS